VFLYTVGLLGNFLGDQIEKNERGGTCSAYRKGVYRVLVGKPDGERPLGSHRIQWENNI
jgi:hypothetical protein